MLEYLGLKSINGPLVLLDRVSGASYEEMVVFHLEDGSQRLGRIIHLEGQQALIQVFEGAHNLSLSNTRARLLGRPVEIPLAPELLGRVFDGAGRPIDGLGEVYAQKWAEINGSAINPVARRYPRNFIQTGISVIDCLTTLIRGQKLPIFSGAGLQHNHIAAQIVKQATLASDENEPFAIVFAAMGVTRDVAEFFRRAFAKAGASRSVMFLNLSNDPIIERILAPRAALTAAEYLAFELDMHILVIMTDLTAYCEALREYGSSRGEIPGRKGYPGYLYSDLASLYERAGIIEGRRGSITQLPILTMPSDDITHPVPDLTGYITEGQIVLDRFLDNTGVYPPVAVLPSLSRLMKDGIGEGYTRADHSPLANQLFASYAKVHEIRALASVIGEEELNPKEQVYMQFGRAFERQFLSQGYEENRDIATTLDIGWKMLSLLPREDLDRIDRSMLDAALPAPL